LKNVSTGIYKVLEILMGKAHKNERETRTRDPELCTYLALALEAICKYFTYH
jgi:hypothetical protein